jgi:hypothetical protein
METNWTVVASGVFGAEPVVVEDTRAPDFAVRFYRLTSP